MFLSVVTLTPVQWVIFAVFVLMNSSQTKEKYSLISLQMEKKEMSHLFERKKWWWSKILNLGLVQSNAASITGAVIVLHEKKFQL